jgi:hypothetical protein
MIAITTVLVAIALAVLVFVLILLILIGANREAPWTSLDDKPPTPLAGFARSVMGVYVRRDNDDHSAKAVAITPAVKGWR